MLFKKIIFIALLSCQQNVFAKTISTKDIEEIEHPSKVTAEMLELGKLIRAEAHMQKDRNPIFKAAWRTNQHGFLNHWDKKSEAEVLKAIKAGVDVNERDKNGRTAIMHAALAPNSGLFLFLKNEANARIDLKDNNGYDLHHLIVLTQNSIAVFSGMRKTIDKSYQGIDVGPILFQAVQNRETAVLKKWFERGVSPDYGSEENSSMNLLSQAAEFDDKVMINFLIAQGADCNAANGQALLRTLGEGKLSLVEYLISKGCHTDVVDKKFFSDGPYQANPQDKLVWAPFAIAADDYFFSGDKKMEKFLRDLKVGKVDLAVLMNTEEYLKTQYESVSKTKAYFDHEKTLLDLIAKKICEASLRE